MKKWTRLKASRYLIGTALGWSIASSGYADQSITNIRVSPGMGSTRVVFDLSGPAQYKLFTLNNPSRVVVDFNETMTRAPDVNIPVDSTVSNVRSAVQANNALRMVLDLKQNVSVKGFLLPPDGLAGHRLVVDLMQPGANVAQNRAAVAAPTVSTPTTGNAGSVVSSHIYGGNPFANADNQGQAYKPAVTAVPAVTRIPTVASASQAVAEVKSIPAAIPSVTAPKAIPAVAVVTAEKPITVQAVVASASPVTSGMPVTAKSTSATAASSTIKAVKAELKSEPLKTVPVKPAKTAAVVTPPKSATPLSPSLRSDGMRDVIVAIDAGHGGQDPGAKGAKGAREKDLTLAIARRLHEELSRQPGVKPALVRTGDYFIPLASRRDIARSKLHADLFVSIHADAFIRPQARGASVFALSRNGATSSLAQMLADRENQADLVGGALGDKDNMVASVIADLALEGAMEHSMKVGGTVLKELGGITPLHKRYIEKAGFAVLKSADFPSILVETGFISNPQEERNLTNLAHQQKLAKAITKGVMAYFNGNPPPGTYLAWKRDKGATTTLAAISKDALTPRGQVLDPKAVDTRHTISRGDTLEKIANRYQVQLSDLRRANALTHNDTIRIGQVLQIPDT